MTCAKKQVTCVLVKGEEIIAVGRNSCRNPQTTCPRLPGEGYEKCKTVCDQPGHAEEIALERAGEEAKGCTAVLFGIGHYCKTCQLKLFEAGVVALKVLNDKPP